jgi:hypothetical protein
VTDMLLWSQRHRWWALLTRSEPPNAHAARLPLLLALTFSGTGTVQFAVAIPPPIDLAALTARCCFAAWMALALEDFVDATWVHIKERSNPMLNSPAQ